MNQFIAVVMMLFPLMPIAIVLRQLVAQGNWFFTWLRGCLIFGLGSACCLLALTAYEVARLDHIPTGQMIAEIHIEDAIEESLVTIRYGDNEKSILMNGDAVKVSARAMHFSGPLKYLLPDTFLKIEQLENRYFDFEVDENPKSLSVAERALTVPLLSGQFDGWLLLDTFRSPLEKIGVERANISAEYIPMVRGAIYHLVWQGDGMNVVPANNQAYEGLGLTGHVLGAL